MKFVIEDCPSGIEELLSESADILQDCVKADGISVLLKECKADKGFYRIRPVDGRLMVEYNSLPALLRGLLYINSVRDITEEKFGECSFTDFGVMIDMSRNAVMKTEEVCNMIRRLAFLGFNYIGLYLEDIMEIPGEPYFGYQRGRYSSDEIQYMDSYASKYGMYLKPYIQTLAHLNQITQYEDYKPFIDTADILLVGDERTYKLIDRILKFVSDNFQTKKVNIGMDEAHMLGLGKYLDQNGFRTRTDIMQEHLSKVIDIANQYDLKLEMWSDMFFRLLFKGQYSLDENVEPDFSAINIPEGLTLTFWDYYSKDHEYYARMLKYHKLLTEKISFAGGAWKWSGIVPDNKNSIVKGRIAIEECRRAKIEDYVVTLWGDDGGEASEFSVLPTLFANADDAYSGDLPVESFSCIAGYSFDDYMRIDTVTPYMNIENAKNNVYKLLLYNDPLFGTFDSVVRDDMTSHFRHSAEFFESMNDGKNFAYLFKTMRDLCRVLELKNDLSRRIYTGYKKEDRAYLKIVSEKEIPEIILRIEEYYASVKSQWMRENKPYGFEVQSIRIGSLILRLKDCAEILDNYCQRRIDRIEELEAERLPMGIYPNVEPYMLNLNVWKKMITPSVI